MPYDLIVANGQIVTPSGIVQGHLLVSEGKIAGIVQNSFDLAALTAADTIDAGGRAVLPGMVDLHVHIGEPGKENKEDVLTGTRAAAAGGITTIVVMPNCVPPVNSRERLLQRADLFRSKSYVDFALLGGAGGESLGHIIEQADAGAVGYKSYIGPYRDDRTGLLCQDTADIYAVLEEVTATGRFIGFHVEDRGVIGLLTSRMLEGGRTDFAAYHESRPEFTETLAMLPLLELARATGVHLYLVHMSSPRAIRLADQWRSEGTHVTIETCPHYLVLSDEDTRREGPYALVAPPLRSPQSREALWGLVAEGVIDVIATDHAPGTAEERALGQKNIFKGGGGLPELEVAWSLLLTEAAERGLALEDLAWLVAENPARTAQLYPQKGALLPGSDADLVIIELEGERTVTSRTMYTKNPDAARIFDGMKLRGTIDMVVQRGHVIARDGVVSEEQRGAHWIRP